MNPGLVASGHFVWHFASYMLTFFPLSLFRLVGMSWETILILFQVFSAILYILANYWFIKQNTNSVLAIVSMIFIAFSLSTQNLASVYYRNIISLSVMIVFLGLYLRYIKDRRKFDIILGSLCVIFLSLQYQPLVIQLFLTLSLFVLVTALSKDKLLSTRHLIMDTIKFFIPILLLFLIATLFLFARTGTFQGSIFEYPIYIFTNDFAFGAQNLLPSTWIILFSQPWYSSFVENPLILLLSLVGLITLATMHVDAKRQLFKNIFLSWFMVTSLLFMFVDPQGELYRMVLNFPFGLTAAFGLILLSRLKVSISISRRKTT